MGDAAMLGWLRALRPRWLVEAEQEADAQEHNRRVIESRLREIERRAETLDRLGVQARVELRMRKPRDE